MALRRCGSRGFSTGRVALLLQGGGSLGMYQVGVFEALAEADYTPDWIAGTSIGAINAAIMAGNPPERCISRLDAFWEAISRPDALPALAGHADLRRFQTGWSSAEALALGQPGFFRPWALGPFLSPPGMPQAVSFYDTRPLRETLEKFVDLDLINEGGIRLSLGAVNVTTGQPVYFDSARQRIGYEHIMASGALPPGFPAVEVEGELYWDGGVLSNTPLDAVLDDEPRVSTLCFMIDLWNPAGKAPQTMDEVLARQKDITYASRSQRHIEDYRRTHDLRRTIAAMWQKLPAKARADLDLQGLAGSGCTTTMNIVHFIYRSQIHETASKDYEFSRASMAEHRAAGGRDARRALREEAWLAEPPPNVGVVVHEVVGGPARARAD